MPTERISFSPAGPTAPVTRLLQAAAAGDSSSSEELLTLVYEQLRAIARQRMAGERAAHTLQATALVHEAYIRLLGRDARWNGRGHFFLAAAEAMRRILIDHARARNAQKRKCERSALDIVNVADMAAETDLTGLLALDDAMSRLEAVAPETAAIVRLRFYAGLSVQAVAEALDVSPRTVKREWAFGRAWLRATLTRGMGDGEGQ